MALDIRRQPVAHLFSEGTQTEAGVGLADRRWRRAVLFEESLIHATARAIYGIGRMLHPTHITELPFLLAFLLRKPAELYPGVPDPAKAARWPDGFCGLARDLSVSTLLEGYACGLYPKAFVGPLKWWTPTQRMVVDPATARTPPSVCQDLGRRTLGLSFDHDFDGVVASCAAAEETLWRPCWMNPKIKNAYAALHDAGFAHSFEVRDNGKLAAGGFGIAIGRVFVCESTFGPTHLRDLALAVLNRHLAAWGFAMHDAKTQIIEGFGFAPMARDTYRRQLLTLLRGGRPGRWAIDPALCEPHPPAEQAETHSEERPLTQAA